MATELMFCWCGVHCVQWQVYITSIILSIKTIIKYRKLIKTEKICCVSIYISPLVEGGVERVCVSHWSYQLYMPDLGQILYFLGSREPTKWERLYVGDDPDQLLVSFSYVYFQSLLSFPLACPAYFIPYLVPFTFIFCNRLNINWMTLTPSTINGRVKVRQVA